MSNPLRCPPTLCRDCGRAISTTSTRCRRCAYAARIAGPSQPQPTAHTGAPTADDIAWIRAAGAHTHPNRLARMVGLDPHTVVAILRESAGL